jgi:maltooligosyltrehalose trehalohydrolase
MERAREPFDFFCDFSGALTDAVRQDRRREYADAYAHYGDEIPEPLSPATFVAAVLDWDARWAAGDEALLLLANLSDTAKPRPVWKSTTPIWGGAPPPLLPPWSVHAAIAPKQAG